MTILTSVMQFAMLPTGIRTGGNNLLSATTMGLRIENVFKKTFKLLLKSQSSILNMYLASYSDLPTDVCRTLYKCTKNSHSLPLKHLEFIYGSRRTLWNTDCLSDDICGFR